MEKLYKIPFRSGLLLTAFLLSFALAAQPPANYYNTASGKSGAELKTALFTIIKGHTVIGYDNLWSYLQFTDSKPDGKVWDMYSNCEFSFSTNQCGNYINECDCYNKEHSFPKSWFGGEVSPMFSDLFHIVPTDGKVNSIRENWPFGTVTSPTYTSGNGSKRGPNSYPGYTGTVFEPIDEYKGDFARNYFYMATRYEDKIASWVSNPGAGAVLNGTVFPCYNEWFLNLLGEWHAADPVSQKEIDRNNAVYGIQQNRNPYIDHPEYVYAVWGVGGATALPEPSNYPASFSAHNIHLQWSDATGTILPAGYLIRMSSSGFNAIAAPIDGTQYASPTDFTVPYGSGELRVKDLNVNTTYYFKIYSFTDSGGSIDYKVDGEVPSLSQKTGM